MFRQVAYAIDAENTKSSCVMSFVSWCEKCLIFFKATAIMFANQSPIAGSISPLFWVYTTRNQVLAMQRNPFSSCKK